MELQDYEIRHLKTLRKYLPECAVLLKSNGDFPLEQPCCVALFGNGARHTLKGGTGSGEVNSRFAITVEHALRRTGFTITTDAWLDAYDTKIEKARPAFLKEIRANARKHHTSAVMEGMGAVMPEPDYDLSTAAAGDICVYVLARICGEGNDRKAREGDFYLTDTEIRDIQSLSRRFSKFMLVLNVGAPIDLSPVLNVPNILLLSQLGVDTGLALSRILLGKANPSGKLTTTWAPISDYAWAGDFGHLDDTYYKEGVYVGYRFFDTYGTRPTFPFGYGLSYTTFAADNVLVTKEDGRIQISAEVTNTGSYAGKEVLQLYVSKPQGRLDQPYQVLAGWAKTSLLAPGESETVMIDLAMTDLASYDTANAAYILEAGSYILRLGTDSRRTEVAVVVKLDRETIVRNAVNRCGDPGFEDWRPDPPVIDVPEDAPILEITGDEIAISVDNAPEKSDAEPEISDGAPESASEVAESVSEAPESASEVPESAFGAPAHIDSYLHGLTDEQLAYLSTGFFNAGKKGFLSVIGDASGSVAGAAGETTKELKSIGIDSLVMADGPAGLRLSPQFIRDEKGIHKLGNPLPDTMMDLLPAPVKAALRAAAFKPKATDTIEEQYCTAIPIGTAIAQSWNLEFAELCGDIVGEEMERFGVHLWLAPALNIHRNILCGRNFEYYSEDPLVSGAFAAAITRGVQKHPHCGTTVKHYCANNQEKNRYQNNSHVSERAMREIYLRGFEIVVKTAQPHALMSSYNLLNGEHTNESKGLMEILRDEFGYEGIVMTDWCVPMMERKDVKYPGPTYWKVIAADEDLIMPGSPMVYEDVLAALKRGDLSREQVETSATRLYRMIEKLKL